MGTRADFYSEDMTWLGSFAWDGHPKRVDIDVLRSTSDAVYRANVARYLAGRDDSTFPERGWPWPWPDSRTTDYSYVLKDGAVHASRFGHPWFKVDPEAECFGEVDSDGDGSKLTCFPDMSAQRNVRYDRGSGVIVVGGHS